MGEDSPVDSDPSSGSRPSHPRTAYVSEELEGQEDEEAVTALGSDVFAAHGPPEATKAVRFSPTADDVTDADSAFGASAPEVVITDASMPLSAAPETGLPAGFIAELITPGPSAPPLRGLPSGFEPTSPPALATSAPLPPPPPPHLPPAPANAPHISRPVRLSPARPQPAPEPETTTPAQELTPVMVARAQKHCRFAISSLDYEDAEQARKELRAALLILGG